MKNWPLALAAGIGAALVAYPALSLIIVASPPKPGRLVPEVDPVTLDFLPSDAAQPSRARFPIRNPGGSPVSIRGFRTSDENAIPSIPANPIPPGASAIVEVQAYPPRAGARTTLITLFTDSPITPEVPLHLQMNGPAPAIQSRLLPARGELIYEADWSPQERRQITPQTQAQPGENTLPRLTIDLPFLAVEFLRTREIDRARQLIQPLQPHVRGRLHRPPTPRPLAWNHHHF